MQSTNKPEIQPQEGDLKVWHIPQVPMQPFYVPVKSTDEAILVLKTLWDYDLFQFENNIKPDYSNASGLIVYLNGEWIDWYDDEDRDIDQIIRDSEA